MVANTFSILLEDSLSVISGFQVTIVGQMLSYFCESTVEDSARSQLVDSSIFEKEIQFNKYWVILKSCLSTFRSKGSPLRTPSIIVTEWQVAIPISSKGGSIRGALPDEELRRWTDIAWVSWDGAINRAKTLMQLFLFVKLNKAMTEILLTGGR